MLITKIRKLTFLVYYKGKFSHIIVKGVYCLALKLSYIYFALRFLQGTLQRAFNPLLYPDFIYNRTKFKQEFNEVGTQMHTYLSQVRKLILKLYIIIYIFLIVIFCKILKCKREEITENNSTGNIKDN